MKKKYIAPKVKMHTMVLPSILSSSPTFTTELSSADATISGLGFACDFGIGFISQDGIITPDTSNGYEWTLDWED